MHSTIQATPISSDTTSIDLDNMGENTEGQPPINLDPQSVDDHDVDEDAAATDVDQNLDEDEFHEPEEFHIKDQPEDPEMQENIDILQSIDLQDADEAGLFDFLPDNFMEDMQQHPELQEANDDAVVEQ